MEELNMIIDLAPIVDVAVDALAGALLGAGLWIAKLIGDKLGLEKEDKIRTYLMKAVENGVAYGEKKAREELGDADWSKIETKNALVAHAAGYVLSKTPDAVAKFKLSEKDVQDLVLAKLTK